MKSMMRINVEHQFGTDREALRKGIEALIRLSDQARASRPNRASARRKVGKHPPMKDPAISVS